MKALRSKFHDRANKCYCQYDIKISSIVMPDYMNLIVIREIGHNSSLFPGLLGRQLREELHPYV